MRAQTESTKQSTWNMVGAQLMLAMSTTIFSKSSGVRICIQAA